MDRADHDGEDCPGQHVAVGGMVIAYIVLGAASIVMLVIVIGALVKLGMQRAGGLCSALLILHLV